MTPRWPLALIAVVVACSGGEAGRKPAAATATRPDLLLVTLDTTRADHVAPEAPAERTPHLAALAARGIRFAQAYSTAPSTLPSHVSMLSGLYPAGHGIHENGRRLSSGVPLLAERLRELGYVTAAFVSGYPLQRQFGLDRGFEVYDDDFGAGANQRPADATTSRALAWLALSSDRPRFLWVHYYDPHEPYSPPEPFRSRYSDDPYSGEIAFVDSELGRLVEGFERGAHKGGVRLLAVGDHGEGLGDHGEALHGSLLYQGVMRVPLLLAGNGIEAGVRHDAVSARQVRATLLYWAGDEVAGSLLEPSVDPVLAEAMQPYLNYRWQPQSMATDGRYKLIRSGGLELYALAGDSAETNNLVAEIEPPRALAKAVADYPVPGAGSAAPSPVDDEARRRLASLGYLTSEAAPASVPPGAPRAADMTRLFEALDAASRAFANGDYARAAPLFERILRDDPANLMTAVRLAVSRSFLGRDLEALAAFALAAQIDPGSIEVKHYLAMHRLKEGQLREAAPLFEAVLAADPARLAALDGLARIRAAEGRLSDAAALLERAAPLAADPAVAYGQLGAARMSLGDTPGAIAAFEHARAAGGDRFAHDLELGVLYLAVRRLDEAADALDRVPAAHPGYPMALFKRAQVGVLRNEPDIAARIRAARENADAVTAPLVANEKLFAGN